MVKYVHFDFQFGLPDGWIDQSTVIITGPPVNDYSPSITVTRDYLEKRQTAQKYAEEQIIELFEIFKDSNYRIVKRGEIEIAGIGAYEIYHTFTIQDIPSTIKQWQVYFTFGNEAIIFTASDTDDHFDVSLPIFQASVGSFVKITNQ